MDEERRTDSHCCFRLRFHGTRICGHVSKVRSDWSDMLRTRSPTAYSVYCLVGFIRDLGLRRITLTCDSEPNTKSLQDSVIQACAGVEVIPLGPLEPKVVWKRLFEDGLQSTEHVGSQLNKTQILASQMAVRCRRLPRFAAQRENTMIIGKDGKSSSLRRTGRRRRKPPWHTLEREFGSVTLEYMVSVHVQAL